jgi:hypothetical protein
VDKQRWHGNVNPSCKIKGKMDHKECENCREKERNVVRK